MSVLRQTFDGDDLVQARSRRWLQFKFGPGIIRGRFHLVQLFLRHQSAFNHDSSPVLLFSIPEIGFPGSGTGYLSPKFGAFSVGGDPAQGDGFQVRDLRLANGLETADFDSRRGLRDIVNNEFAALEADPTPLETMDSFYQQAYTMISSPAVRDAFDLSKEPDELMKAYGFGRFLENGHYGQPYGSQAGMRMLLTRRLVEAGARFVTLTFGGWDDHVQIRDNYQKQMPPLDNALATLIRDLDDRGMLDSTLI